jgi:hypothetical protein
LEENNSFGRTIKKLCKAGVIIAKAGVQKIRHRLKEDHRHKNFLNDQYLLANDKKGA